MSNSVCVFVYLLFVLDLSFENHYRDHISCLCSRLNNSLCVGCVVIIPAFALLRFLKLLMQNRFEHGTTIFYPFSHCLLHVVILCLSSPSAT